MAARDLKGRRESRYFATLRKNRLELLLILAEAALLLWAILKGSFIVAGDLLFASLLAIIGSYCLAYHALRIDGVRFERVFVSLAAAVSGIWLYELVYHYMWEIAAGLSLADLWKDLVYASTNIDGVRFPLVWSMMMISLPLAAYRRMSVNRIFLAVIGLSIILFTTWAAIGFPQFFLDSPPPGYEHFRFTDNSNQWALAAFIFNSGTKVLNLAPALLFYRSRSRRVR